MKYFLLSLCALTINSCGLAGKTLGTVARLPVDIARTAVGAYDEGNTIDPTTDIENFPY